MFEIPDARLAVEQTLALHVRERQCGIAYVKDGVWTIGTGSAIQLNDKVLLATCKHVADDFFTSDKTQILFEQGLRLTKSDVRYVNGVDAPIDQALIEISTSSELGHYYSESDFDLVDDFACYDFSSSNLFVYGYPSERVEEKSGGYLFPRFSFLTTALESSGDKLILSYPKGTDQIVTKTGLDIPNPRGMSGALVLAVPHFEDDTVWSPTNSRVIAMQYAWNTKNCLFASSIRHIVSLAF